jgi:adenylate cyclase class 1
VANFAGFLNMPHPQISNASKRIKRPLTPDFSEGVDRKLLMQVRDRFMQINNDRLEKTRDGLSMRHNDVLAILPLLYHINHPLMPGYVGKETPHGLAKYEPEKYILDIAKSFSRTFRFRKDKRAKQDLQSLFMMGSTGTLAHSESSDIDLWLCVEPDLAPDSLERLQQKAKGVDQWALEQGLEVHTFIMSAAGFKGGESAPKMDAESSGSAQHYLLLDEFYRTAILLAGRYPLWWLIPPALELDYDQYTDLLLSRRFIKEADVIDFGTTAHIPKSELIGAGLWQLYKGLDSPYKSVLKLLLAELYAQELPDRPCLSIEFKEAVYNDELSVEQLDPYLRLYHRLENYLSAIQAKDRLQLIRKSFYLKVNKRLSRRPAGYRPSWQRLVLSKLVQSWDWSENDLRHLDDRMNWKIDQVIIERQALLNELTYSYRFLAAYAREHKISSSITKTDLNLLGRKLYATFQRKAGKIERINPGIAPNLWEENLAIHHASSQTFQTDKNAWLLYRNLAAASDASFSTPLRKATSLIELIAWLYFNGVISRTTRLSVVPGDTQLSVVETQNVINALAQSFPMPLPAISQQRYIDAAYVERILLIVNIGIDPLQDTLEEGLHRVSDRTDSFGYSAQRFNLVKTIDQVVLNSWGEVSAVRYEVGETLMQNLQAYLQLCLEQQDEKMASLQVKCFSAQRADAIARRVNALFESVRDAFFNDPSIRNGRYLVGIATQYFLIQRSDDQFRYATLASHEQALAELALTEHVFSPISLDPYSFEEEHFLKAMLPQNKAHVIQIFYITRDTFFELCVLDECGSMMQFTLPLEDESMLQYGLYNYLSCIIERRQLSESLHGDMQVPNIEINCVKPIRNEKFKIELCTRIPIVAIAEVQAIGFFDGDAIHYDLHLPNQDFPFHEYGDQQIPALKHYLKSQTIDITKRPLKLAGLSFPTDPMRIRSQGSQRYGTLDYLRLYQQHETAFH